MAGIFRQSTPVDDAPRFTMGIHLDAELHRIEAALVAMRGRHAGAPLEVVHSITHDIPPEPRAAYQAIRREDGTASWHGGLLHWGDLRTDLIDLIESAIVELQNDARPAPHGVLAVGVDDPGVWTLDGDRAAFYAPLVDAPLLAERTGMNVVGAFPARDIACGGRGGPIATLAEWILLKAAGKHRVLLDLDGGVRLTLLPKASVGNPRNRILSLELPIDPPSTGADVADPLEAWKAEFTPPRAAPSWRPFLHASNEDTTSNPIRQAHTAWRAWTVAETIRESLPGEELGQGVLLGAPEKIAKLRPALAEATADLPWLTLEEAGQSPYAFRAVCAALLTLLHLDQVPTNLPLVTGADVARVLGELTPGAPRNWQALLEEFTGSRPTIRPLRSAL